MTSASDDELETVKSAVALTRSPGRRLVMADFSWDALLTSIVRTGLKGARVFV